MTREQLIAWKVNEKIDEVCTEMGASFHHNRDIEDLRRIMTPLVRRSVQVTPLECIAGLRK
jgi:hypothetical protein